MSTPKSADPNDYVVWRVCIAGVILLILLGALAWMMADAGKEQTDKTKPIGAVVDVTKYDDYVEANDALVARLARQPSQDAVLNALAQEGCAVTNELQRRHPGDADAQYLDPLYQERFMPVHDLYYLNADPDVEEFAITGHMKKYCKDYTP